MEENMWSDGVRGQEDEEERGGYLDLRRIAGTAKRAVK
jgi:hypothetical protein